jgi:CheY-like chemotaxis protein
VAPFPREEAAGPPHRPKTLLVVDDEPTNIALIRMVVEASGADVHLLTAAGGEEAVAHARAGAPDLILMDLQMPGLDGWEATRRLKADPATVAIPVIAVTAQAMPGDRAQALAAGCDDYVTKPIDIQWLLALLEQHFA